MCFPFDWSMNRGRIAQHNTELIVEIIEEGIVADCHRPQQESETCDKPKVKSRSTIEQ